MRQSPQSAESAAEWREDPSEGLFYREIDTSGIPPEGLCPARGFFFGMVENGTIVETEPSGAHRLTAGTLLILSPSRSCRLHDASPDFRMLVIALLPDFFDTLPDGQPMYGQLIRRANASGPLLLHPDAASWRHLLRTVVLYAESMAPFTTCRRGIIRHWCGLFLLQITDILHRDSESSTGPLCVKRADQLFREFKKLSVEHYRHHHDIGFYAEALHISTTYLSRIVKRTTGHTVYTHLAGLLSAEARRYLESTDKDIKEIADRLGFADQSSFGKFFKSQSEFSPHHYRQRFGRTPEKSPGITESL